LSRGPQRLFTHPRVRALLAPDRARIAWSVAAMTGRALLALGVPFFFGRTIGLIADGSSAAVVWRQAGYLVGTAVLTAFCQYWMRWIYIGVSRSFEFRLRNELFAHLSKLGFSYFNTARTGDLMSRLTADVEAVRMGIGPGVMHLYPTSLMAVGALAIMAGVSWKLTLFAMIPMVVLLLLCTRLMPKWHDAAEKVQEQLSKLSSLAQESFSGTRVVKAFARESYETGRFKKESSAYIDDSMVLAMTRAHFHIMIEVMAGVVTVALLWFGGRQVIQGELSFGLFAAFYGYFIMLVWPMIAIGWTLSLFQRAVVALARLDAVLETKPDIVSGSHVPAEVRGDWSIRGLTFTHAAAPAPVLRDITLDIPAGTAIAIVGPTGAGKSTLIQLLGRLLDPPAGSVFLDGRDVRELDLGALRRSIAMVPQETFLFSDTIRANIAYSEPNATEEDVHAAAEAAQVKDAILGFPHGFDEVIGERGITLSGGQKQRVAIARALIHAAPTLILDDCLSAVDTDTEERILGHLERLMAGRTTVIIAHRLSSVMHCDQIFVLKDGVIAERGNHEALVALGGWYASTYRHQLLSRELEAA
jgi:ATP-binding cassette, subfamily B, multidrug efflux pump